MNVLIACEESQEVCKAFRARGHQAFSCDIQECSGGHPEWHIQCNVLDILYDSWDLIIAHPPCTDLAVSGARHFARKRADGRQQKSIDFFMKFTDLDCPRVAIENPISIMSTLWRKPDQIVQPFWFGHHYRKSTCLWLKGLPLLVPTDMVDPGEFDEYGFSKNFATRYAVDENGKILSWNDPRTAKMRSKTPWGLAEAMAEAMAEQWG